MAKKLTAGVLQGTAYRETITVEWMGEQYEVDIRPLNNKEATEVEALMQEGINIKATQGAGGNIRRNMRFEFDSKANLKGRRKADVLAVAYGTVDESITIDVVENEFPPKLISEIADRIKEISGIEEPDLAEEGETFPEN